MQQNSITHWPELLRLLTLLIEVPKLSRLAIINGVPFGCPSGTMNKRVLKKNGRWNSIPPAITKVGLSGHFSRFGCSNESQEVRAGFACLRTSTKDCSIVTLEAFEPAFEICCRLVDSLAVWNSKFSSAKTCRNFTDQFPGSVSFAFSIPVQSMFWFGPMSQLMERSLVVVRCRVE